MDKAIAKGKAVLWILEAVDRALKKYSANNIDVVENEETGMLDVIYHCENNSFAIQSNISNMKCLDELDKKILVEELDKRSVGHCWLWTTSDIMRETEFGADYMCEHVWPCLLKALKVNEENNRHGFWTDGDEILCKSEAAAEMIADFLEDLGVDCIHTGYYDPTEDKRDNCVDGHTGYWYVSPD